MPLIRFPYVVADFFLLEIFHGNGDMVTSCDRNIYEFFMKMRSFDIFHYMCSFFTIWSQTLAKVLPEKAHLYRWVVPGVKLDSLGTRTQCLNNWPISCSFVLLLIYLPIIISFIYVVKTPMSLKCVNVYF